MIPFLSVTKRYKPKSRDIALASELVLVKARPYEFGLHVQMLISFCLMIGYLVYKMRRQILSATFHLSMIPVSVSLDCELDTTPTLQGKKSGSKSGASGRRSLQNVYCEDPRKFVKIYIILCRLKYYESFKFQKQ